MVMNNKTLIGCCTAEKAYKKNDSDEDLSLLVLEGVC